MNELIEFLNARLDEDEAVIRRNLGTDGLGDNGCFPDYRTYSDADTDAADDFLDRFRPPRMLDEVKAKRAIIAGHPHYTNPNDAAEIACDTCHICGYGSYYEENRWCDTVKALASIYRNHPDWREEWRPDVR